MKKVIQIFLLGIMLMIPSAVLADDGVHQTTAYNNTRVVESNAYFDSRTGHKYLKADDQTYMEFSKKGLFLKTVPSTLPLLVGSPSIHPICEENYILYKKNVQGKTLLKILDAAAPHPEGWRAQKLLLVLN